MSSLSTPHRASAEGAPEQSGLVLVCAMPDSQIEAVRELVRDAHGHSDMKGVSASAQPDSGPVFEILDTDDSKRFDASLRRAGVLLVGSPISAGLAAFHAGESIASALHRWAEQVERIEGALASSSACPTIMLAESVIADPDAFADALFKMTGGRPRQNGPSRPSQPESAMTQAIIAVVAGDVALRRLYQSLRARAVPTDPGGHDVAEWPVLHARYQLPAAHLDAFAQAMRRESELSGKLESINAERAAASESPELKAELEDAKREGELLLIQLHQVQEELEHYYLQWREAETALEQARKNPSPEFPGDARITGLSLGDARTEGPYSSLDAVVGEAGSGGREWRNLAVRLLEHHGAPGLAVFADPAAPPLSVWHAHGSEAGRPFMLIVPSDTGFSAVWQAFPTAEWQLLVEIVQQFELALREAQREDHMRWVEIAQRLLVQLQELPPRFRYDQLRVEASGQDGLQVHFDNVMFGRRRFEGVCVSWLPGRAEVRLPAKSRDGQPVLSRRPAEMQADTAWSVPVVPHTPAAQRLAAWSRISHGDQQYVLALLDALPAVPARLSASNVRLSQTVEELERLARLPLRQAQQDLGGGRLRAILRRFLRPAGPVRA